MGLAIRIFNCNEDPSYGEDINLSKLRLQPAFVDCFSSNLVKFLWPPPDEGIECWSIVSILGCYTIFSTGFQLASRAAERASDESDEDGMPIAIRIGHNIELREIRMRMLVIFGLSVLILASACEAAGPFHISQESVKSVINSLDDNVSNTSNQTLNVTKILLNQTNNTGRGTTDDLWNWGRLPAGRYLNTTTGKLIGWGLGPEEWTPTI
jgi:hypothetical protein